MEQTDKDIKKLIKKDPLIRKFCFYGLFKNLKFFEPFLVIYLLSMDLSLFSIGVLYSIREITNYIFEVPSGLFADHYGKKTELLICFVMYIISFVFFFIGGAFYILCIAFVFFGLGEAFRSGTHKAIIMSYLEEKQWFSFKSFVYGRTRSFSMVGSSVSSFVSVVFILGFGSLRLLFLFCIVPYIIDFILIASYPKRFNEKNRSVYSFKDFLRASADSIKSIARNKQVRKVLVSSSFFDAVTSTIKDYIQPILQAIILASSIAAIGSLDKNDVLSIYLAAIYGVVYLLSAAASRHVYRLDKFIPARRLMDIFLDVLAAAFLLLALFVSINSVYVIIAVYFIVFILRDSRKPVFVDAIGDLMDKKERVTTLSIDSQLKALFVIILAPLLGFLADRFSIPIMFVVLGVLAFAVNRAVSSRRKAKS